MNRSVVALTLALTCLLPGCSAPSSPAAATPPPSKPSASRAKPNSPLAQPPTATLSSVPLAGADADRSQGLTDTAHFLAGMPVKGSVTLQKLQQSAPAKTHTQIFNTAFKRLQVGQLAKVRQWSDQELKSLRGTTTIFYPFSGPDFLYAHSFFPQGTTYVLLGLEPVGPIPNFEKASPAQVSAYLPALRNSLKTVLGISFFKTIDMKVDFEKKGLLPALYVFLARTQHRLLQVQYIQLGADGSVTLLTKGSSNGIKIDFVSESSPTLPRTLYYFSTNLSDSAFTKNIPLQSFIKQLPAPVTYLKAASYLMHYGNFSGIRNLALNQSSSLLQDDSGMPLRAFNSKIWNLTFYGRYIQPINLFKEEYQPDLRKIYQNNKAIKPLPFPIGYGYGAKQSNLMLALKKAP